MHIRIFLLNYCLLDIACFYLCREQFHQSLWKEKTNCSKHHCSTEPMTWKNASTSTVRRSLREAGLYGRIAIKKPHLRKQNHVKRLQWATVLKYWTIKQWNKIFWTDESKFEMFGSNKRVYVHRRVGERAAIPSIIHEGGSLYHAWRGVCYGVEKAFPIVKSGICTR